MSAELTPVGTLYVAPNGDAYRLSGYGVDWHAEPFTAEDTLPHYSVSYVGGGFSSRNELPAGVRVVWSPVSVQEDS